jgi:hypothetical protein
MKCNKSLLPITVWLMYHCYLVLWSKVWLLCCEMFEQHQLSPFCLAYFCTTLFPLFSTHTKCGLCIAYELQGSLLTHPSVWFMDKMLANQILQMKYKKICCTESGLNTYAIQSLSIHSSQASENCHIQLWCSKSLATCHKELSILLYSNTDPDHRSIKFYNLGRSWFCFSTVIC